jgi:diguanylate cyclase (GGDEF)-like protein
LHQAWARTVATLLALIFCLGMVALGATQYQRVEFAHTTSGFARDTSALSVLSHALVAVNGVPTVGMLYGSPKNLPASRASYGKVSNTVTLAFANTTHVMTTPIETRALNNADSQWRALNTAILTAPTTFSHPAVLAAVVAGKDPFQRLVWDRLNSTEAGVADVAALSAVQLGKQNNAIGRVETLIPPLVAIALATALLLTWLAARRMSRQVVAPILTLRRAALTMASTTPDGPIDLPGATAELQDLAATINESAASLRSSHGLLRDQAYTDALTGLPNRKAFTERLATKLAAQPGGRLGVLFIDLDDFKVVNDSLGHAAGDELLRVVGRRLRSATRGCEIVARLGGDEFAVALECGGQNGSGTAVGVAQRALAALQEPVSIESTNLTISASIGIAISDPGAGVDAADSLLRNADFSMYLAKGQGKNRLEVFAASMHAEMVSRVEFTRELGEAARRNQFVVHYQPVIDIGSGAVIGFEALARWQHPTQGLLAPAEFIGLAEETGAIVRIGEWVLDRACRDYAARPKAASPSPDLWMSVNVSPRQLNATAFASTVKDILRRHSVPPNCLIIELTESLAITNPAASTSALAELRRHGVHVALDDFGMGFSSLRYLHELPIDVIKIDRSFLAIQGAPRHSMLEAIVTMGSSLGLTMIVEGIEESAELERLRGFDQLGAQGSFIARPMPAGAAAEFLRTNIEAARDGEKFPVGT